MGAKEEDNNCIITGSHMPSTKKVTKKEKKQGGRGGRIKNTYRNKNLPELRRNLGGGEGTTGKRMNSDQGRYWYDHAR